MRARQARLWPRLTRAALTAVVALGLAGCGTLTGFEARQTEAVLAQPPADLPRRLNLAAVPFFPQTALQCGPAVMATLLQHAGRPVSPDTLARAVFVPERGGSLQLEMLAAGRAHDVVPTPLPPRLEAVLREVAAGHPVGVLLNLSLPIAPMWHYAVVVGYDLDQREIVLRSGETREQRMPLATFEHTWARSRHWAFVALPPGELPATAEPAAVRDALLGFGLVAPPARAVTAWEAAATRWPDDPVLGLGLGNSHVSAGDLPRAAAVFAAVAQRTDSAAAWNNLAAARLHLGDLPAAEAAARRAVQRATEAEPAWREAALATQSEVAAARAAAR